MNDIALPLTRNYRISELKAWAITAKILACVIRAPFYSPVVPEV